MTYWEKYGFNEAQLAAHLRLVELDENDKSLAQELQKKNPHSFFNFAGSL